MKKEELKKIKLPLSRKDFNALKKALEWDEIDRPDFPRSLLTAMDKMWAKDNAKIYEKKLESGFFGEYD